MCHLCGKCKKANIGFGDCAITPKFKWVSGPNGGYLKKTTKWEKIFNKVLTKAHIFGKIYIWR